MTRARRHDDAGVVLINVLVILSIASIVVFLMLRSQETSLERAQMLSAASAADALVRGAEASAVTALRRDMKNAPESDHYGESWATVSQDDVTLDAGRFSVQIRDAQSRLNLSRLRPGAIAEVQILERVLSELGISKAVGARIAAEVIARPGLDQLSNLRSVPAQTLAVISQHMDLLGSDATLNLNTADPVLLRAVLNNRSVALRAERLRASKGFLTSQDLTRLGSVRPPAAGFTSQTFDVVSETEVDGISVRLTSRIVRSRSFAGPAVNVIRRQYGVPVSSIPPLPAKS